MISVTSVDPMKISYQRRTEGLSITVGADSSLQNLDEKKNENFFLGLIGFTRSLR